MIRVRIGGIRLRLNPLVVVMIPLAKWLAPGKLGFAMIALAVHETAHIIAARLKEVQIDELEIMPFGGVARFENLYGMGNGNLAFISAAGPISNIIFMIVCGALGWWGIMPQNAAASAIKINFILAVFNLMPALPLDGGRILYAALSGRFGMRRMLDIGIWIGRGLALVLLALAIAGAVIRKSINLTIIMSAVLLIFSGGVEKKALNGTSARAALNRLSPIKKPMPVKLYAADVNSAASDLIKKCRPGVITIFAAFDGSGLVRFIDERHIQSSLIENSK